MIAHTLIERPATSLVGLATLLVSGLGYLALGRPTRRAPRP
jgi:hypothetical protein